MAANVAVGTTSKPAHQHADAEGATIRAGQYADVLREMHRRFDYATDQWLDVREEAQTDMRYVAGDPWEPKDRRQREDAGRPCLSLDELSQYTNQLINEIRQHKRAIKVTPTGAGANDQTAEFRQNLFRQIEYRSKAQQAYTTMFQNAVERSYGFLQVTAQYCSTPRKSGGGGDAFDQELRIEAVVNPDLVTLDPDALSPDGADMRYAWVAESWALSDYRRRFPKAKVIDFDSQLAKAAPTWMSQDRIRVANYWTVDYQRQTLYLFKHKVQGPDGQVVPALEVFEEDLEEAGLADVEPDASRTVERPIPTRYLTNGFEVLEAPYIWPGKSIPIVACYGKVLYLDEGSGAKRKILSLVRLARDPQMLYCYYRTCEAELVGMTPKVPYFVRRGSLATDELVALQKSLHEPVAVIQVEGVSDRMPAGVLPEFPQRNPYEPPIQQLEIGAESARRAIQAAMGISPLPTQAQRLTEKSGKALEQIRDSEQQGSFHFIDAYEGAITRVAVLMDEVVPAFYDSARNVLVRTPTDQTQPVRINDPDPAHFPKGQTAPMHTNVGEHDVTLSTGPSFDSERDAANDFADTLVQEVPNIAPVIGAPAAAKLLSLGVKLKQLGPIGDEIADTLAPPSPDGLPPQVQNIVQSLQSENQQLKQLIATKQVEQQADREKAQLDNATKLQVAQLQQDTELKKAYITVSAQLAAVDAKIDAENARTFVDAEQSGIAKILDLHLAKVHKVMDQLHEAKTQAADQQHERQMAEVEHQHALAEQQQAADLAPAPTAAQPSA